MAIDPRTPVLCGGGQFIQRPADPADALEPVAMMVEAVSAAADDAGSRRILGAVDLVAVVRGAWSYTDPGRIVAERIGSPHARTGLTANGGNTPQSLVNGLALRVASGDLDVAVIAGGEAIHSRRRARAEDLKLATTRQEGVEPDEWLTEEIQMSSDFELSRGFSMPVQFYPAVESAIRFGRRETISSHRDRISRLWERFNEVAVDNPYGWSRTAMTAAEIRDPSPENRMVGFPYTKAMNSNWFLDLAAALIVTSVGAADRLGVPADRRVFIHAGTDAHDTYLISNRQALAESPAIRVAAKRVFELAGIGTDDVAHADIYSCFPSAVQVSATEIGLRQDDERVPLTVTGGLTFAGGPLNNYVTHSIATMLEIVRSDAGSLGLVTANGGYLTKHAIGLYSTAPPAAGFKHEDVQGDVDKLPTRDAAPDHTGPVTIEAYTVMHGREGPEQGLFSLLTEGGQRTFGTTNDQNLMSAAMAEEFVGRRADLDGAGTVRAG